MSAATRFLDRIAEALGPPEPPGVFVLKMLSNLLCQIPGIAIACLLMHWFGRPDLAKWLLVGAAAGFFFGGAADRYYRLCYWRRRTQSGLSGWNEGLNQNS
ncbi:MAG: hypothetical protein V4671_16350 [Armatimonadota bacterium]